MATFIVFVYILLNELEPMATIILLLVIIPKGIEVIGLSILLPLAIIVRKKGTI